MAPERARRPHDILPKKKARIPAPIATCPFEDIRKSGNWPPIAALPDERGWRVVTLPNKYPALSHEARCGRVFRKGYYRLAEGVGHHELIITRDHNKNFAHLGLRDGVEVFRMLQARYHAFTKDKCLRYGAAFFNWGAGAGASVYHPHYQILGLPIIPPDVEHSLQGSMAYYAKHRRCVHCAILSHEIKEKKRIIAKNKHVLAVAPFASKESFEVRIYPRVHQPYFEDAPLSELKGIVAVLQKALLKIERHLNDPDFNFFIHTAPLTDRARYTHYHWHIEIVPKIDIPAGFELETGILINVVDPDRVSRMLRGER